MPPGHFPAVDPDNAAVIHIELQLQCWNCIGIRHDKLMTQVHCGIIVSHVGEECLVVVVAVADAGASGFPFVVFTVAHLPPCGSAPGRRRGALFITPFPIVMVDEDNLFPRCFAQRGDICRGSPTPTKAVVQGGMDQLDRPAVSNLNRPWKLPAVFHLIDNLILPVPQN